MKYTEYKNKNTEYRIEICKLFAIQIMCVCVSEENIQTIKR